jgi:diguanylate cyclase (GGDEF)-like protein
MNFIPKILFADDESDLLELYQEYLAEEKYQIITAADGKETLEKAYQEMPHVFVLDINMPLINGFDVCSKLRQDPRFDKSIIIFLSTRREIEDKIKGLELGADDYLTKPFNNAELIARIRSALRMVRLQFNLEQVNRELKSMADQDYLTGLFNMRYFYQALDQSLKNIPPENIQLACVLFDLDHFKSIVDNHGHLFGSKILADIGAILCQSIASENSLMARYGGDEFIMLIPDKNPADIEKIIFTLLNQLNMAQFHFEQQTLSGISASFGVSFYDPQLIKKPQDLIKYADLALFKAKSQGRGCIEFYLHSQPQEK